MSEFHKQGESIISGDVVGVLGSNWLTQAIYSRAPLKVVHVVGGPGCRKTSALQSITEDAYKQVHCRGYGVIDPITGEWHVIGKDKPETQILSVAYAKAAAQELAGRISEAGITLDSNSIGTLHGIIYRVTGRSIIPNYDMPRPEWIPIFEVDSANEWNRMYSRLKVTPVDTTLDNPKGSEGDSRKQAKGDEYLAEINRLRSKRVPLEKWPPRVKRFFTAYYVPFKEQHECIDFTDIIENAFSEMPNAPYRPYLIVVDEAQDLSRLELDLIWQWASSPESLCRYLILAYDPNQRIYAHKGVESQILDELQCDKRIILPESWRLPRTVYHESKRWITRCRYKSEIGFEARNVEGSVTRKRSIRLNNLDMLVSDVRDHMIQGDSCMVLTSCDYMLTRVRGAFFKHGIPFSNHYRPSRREWNPLALPDKDVVLRGRWKPRSIDCLRFLLLPIYEKGFWKPSELLFALQILRTDCVAPGARKALTAMIGSSVIFRKVFEESCDSDGSDTSVSDYFPQDAKNEMPISKDMLNQLLSSEMVDHVESGDLDWLLAQISDKAMNATIRYALKVVKHFGLETLWKGHQLITVGTIHSVKGGEADVVYLFPDISPAAKKQLVGVEKDTVIRAFYVGMTRAKRDLVLCGPTYREHVTW